MTTRARCPYRFFFVVAAAMLVVGGARPARAAGPLKVYETKYYELHTDFDDQARQETILRITLMAEEFHQRTQGLAGAVNERLPLYLYSNYQNYLADGAPPGTAGFFKQGELRVVASPANPDDTWHTVQHEGFHQFIMAAVGRGIPIWANEGLAEYFGEGVFTGDQFFVGLIPPKRLARLQKALSEGKAMSLQAMMNTSHEIWNTNLRGEHYDMAWSMVQFLGHADNGRYQNAFMGFLRNVSRQVKWERAWADNFGGNNIVDFQQRWQEYWERLPENPTGERYDQATVSTIVSFYARALSQRQKFDTPDDFFEAAKADTLKCNPQNWLPRRLLEAAVEKAPDVGEWSFKGKSAWKAILCKMPNGTVLEGTFKISDGKATSVDVVVRKKGK